MHNFRIESYEADGTWHDVREIGAETRKTALLIACRRARMMLRDLARLNYAPGRAIVRELDAAGAPVGPSLYTVEAK